MITGAILTVLIVVVGVTDTFGEPSNYLIGILGTAAGTFFGALSTDKAKKEADVVRMVEKTKAKVDELETVAREEHPDTYRHIDDDDGGRGS